MADNPECRSVLAWGPCDARYTYVKSHSYLETRIRNAVLNEQVAVGMPAAAVLASWGAPDKRRLSSGGAEEWTWGHYPDKRGHFQASETVHFQNGVVTSWSARR
ncbi:MAG: hypothetical protein HY246_22250 [Proteobacteria bacterium]|nr:hypothetical protein [Pseudomonadota bacterium]